MPTKQCRFFLISVIGLACIAVLAAPATGMAGEEGAARYTASVSDVPLLRGFMGPLRDLIEKDLEQLARWKTTLLRYQITRNWWKQGTDRDLDDYDAFVNAKLDNLEKMLPVAHRLGIRIIVDLHTYPGGRGEYSIMNLFDETKYADHFVAVWQRIARRFKDHEHKEAIWAYDLLNEPILSKKATAARAADTLFLRAAKAIRAIDPDTVIVVGAARGSNPAAFADLRPLPLENVIYQAHLYSPFIYTHQFVVPEATPPVKGSNDLLEYPGLIDNEFWDKDRIRKELQPVRDFELRHGVRIYIGEFSAVAWAPNADVYLRDCIEIFEEYGWDWSYHSFREWEAWSLEHEATPPSRFWPSKDNPRKRAVLSALEAK